MNRLTLILNLFVILGGCKSNQNRKTAKTDKFSNVQKITNLFFGRYLVTDANACISQLSIKIQGMFSFSL